MMFEDMDEGQIKVRAERMGLSEGKPERVDWFSIYLAGFLLLFLAGIVLTLMGVIR